MSAFGFTDVGSTEETCFDDTGKTFDISQTLVQSLTGKRVDSVGSISIPMNYKFHSR